MEEILLVDKLKNKIQAFLEKLIKFYSEINKTKNFKNKIKQN